MFLFPAAPQTRLLIECIWSHTHEEGGLNYGNGCDTGRRHGKMYAISKTEPPCRKHSFKMNQEDESYHVYLVKS